MYVSELLKDMVINNIEKPFEVSILSILDETDDKVHYTGSLCRAKVKDNLNKEIEYYDTMLNINTKQGVYYDNLQSLSELFYVLEITNLETGEILFHN